MVERSVTEHLIIKELCRQLFMNEDQLLRFLVNRARIYHDHGYYTLQVGRSA